MNHIKQHGMHEGDVAFHNTKGFLYVGIPFAIIAFGVALIILFQNHPNGWGYGFSLFLMICGLQQIAIVYFNRNQGKEPVIALQKHGIRFFNGQKQLAYTDIINLDIGVTPNGVTVLTFTLRPDAELPVYHYTRLMHIVCLPGASVFKKFGKRQVLFKVCRFQDVNGDPISASDILDEIARRCEIAHESIDYA